MKQCATCGESREESEFNWRNKRLGKKWGTCQYCQRKQQKRWYKKNKERHKANMYEQRLNKQEEGRDYIYEYLSSHPCERCGESDPRVLEFHHVGKKRSSVTRLMRNGHSIDVLQNEIDECIVLCSNCHKKETYKGSWRDRD